MIITALPAVHGGHSRLWEARDSLRAGIKAQVLEIPQPLPDALNDAGLVDNESASQSTLIGAVAKVCDLP